MYIEKIIGFLSWLIPLELSIGLILGTFLLLCLNSQHKSLFLYLVVCLFTDILSRILGEINGSNLILFIVFSLIELLFFMYYIQRFHYKKINYIWIMATGIAAIFIIYEMITLSNVNDHDLQIYSKTVYYFVALGITMDYLFTSLKSQLLPFKTIQNILFFLMYLSINIILFLPFNFLINVPSPIKFYFWLFYLVLTFAFYGYLILEIWKNGVKQKPLQHA